MIRAAGLSKRFGPVHALRRVDLEVPEGQRVAVMGPNGSGKSTLLGLASGLYRPTEGTIEINDAPPRARKAVLGFLGHESYLYPYLTLAENLRFFAGIYGAEAASAERLIEQMGLQAKRDALVHTLSRGQVQRAAIARAMVHAPDVLILDEPFTGLDEASVAAITGMLAERRGTLLVATHSDEQAASLADRVIRLEAGRIV